MGRQEVATGPWTGVKNYFISGGDHRVAGDEARRCGNPLIPYRMSRNILAATLILQVLSGTIHESFCCNLHWSATQLDLDRIS